MWISQFQAGCVHETGRTRLSRPIAHSTSSGTVHVKLGMPKPHEEGEQEEEENEEEAPDRCTLHPDTRAQVHPPPSVPSLVRLLARSLARLYISLRRVETRSKRTRGQFTRTRARGRGSMQIYRRQPDLEAVHAVRKSENRQRADRLS